MLKNGLVSEYEIILPMETSEHSRMLLSQTLFVNPVPFLNSNMAKRGASGSLEGYDDIRIKKVERQKKMLSSLSTAKAIKPMKNLVFFMSARRRNIMT